MLLPGLREQVLEANLELVRRGLALYTFGNASGIHRDQGLIAIKPSGVDYETMMPPDLPKWTDDSGRVVGTRKLNPREALAKAPHLAAARPLALDYPHQRNALALN